MSRPSLLRRALRWLGRQAVRAYHWDAAKTDRLNESRHQYAADVSVNEWLNQDLSTLRARCRDEADRNPMVDGVIFTHQVDITGKDGPELQVQSDSPAYDEWLEDHWETWWRAPTPNPRMSGTEVLRVWVRSLWTKGEFVAQKIVLGESGTPVKMRIQPIDPRRVETPMSVASDDDVYMGIRLSRLGAPIAYYVAKVDSYWGMQLTTDYEEVPARDIIHHFVRREEDQIRGCPWLASALPTIAELREYDKDVGDAARQAAMMGVYWSCEAPDGAPMNVQDSQTIERGVQTTGPPGWRPNMLIPQQPSTQYSDYRQERQSELGRPVGMPLMIVRLDAGRHNYSSARFDGRNYDRACHTIQTSISGTERSAGALNELVDDVAREARLAELAQGLNPPERPARVAYHWTWPRPPHIDPEKEAQATRTKLEIGTIAYQDALAEEGETLEGMVTKRRRADDALADANLPPVPGIMARGTAYALHAAAGGQPVPEPGNDQGDGDDEDDDEDKNDQKDGGDENEGKEK